MIINNMYCQVSGMVMRCIADINENFITGSVAGEQTLPIVCEIGCADGQGVARYGGFCDHVYCIDPMVNGRGDVQSSKFEKIKRDEQKVEKFYENINHCQPESRITLIEKCSAWEETVSELKEHLQNTKLDILVIDGCHHPFEAVWKDFVMYEPFVQNGGYIIFDDTYEPCIKKAFEKTQDQPYNMIWHRQWRRSGGGLQEVSVIQKP